MSVLTFWLLVLVLLFVLLVWWAHWFVAWADPLLLRVLAIGLLFLAAARSATGGQP